MLIDLSALSLYLTVPSLGNYGLFREICTTLLFLEFNGNRYWRVCFALMEYVDVLMRGVCVFGSIHRTVLSYGSARRLRDCCNKLLYGHSHQPYFQATDNWGY